MTEHIADVYPRLTDIDVARAHGSTVVAEDGTEYLDFTSGIAVTNTGHCHPRVVAAIQEQAARFIHAQIYLFRHPWLRALAARLSTVTPDGIDSFFFSNSGAEAVEAAVKLARQATRRPNVIVFEGSFHGRTALTMAMTTSNTGYRAGYQPLPSGVFVAPYPHAFETGRSEDDEVRFCTEMLHRLLRRQSAPSETAAIVIEPVLGEGGYIPAPAGFLRALREICSEHGILLVFDEVQSGFGRTGRFFAAENAGVAPDVMTMAKGMASGFPIAAIGARAELMARWPPGSHGGTYCGNAVGCAAALATIDVIEEEGLLANARARGEQLTAGLRGLQAQNLDIGDVRGPGLMIGCEICDPAGQPDGARVGAIIAHCRSEEHVLFMSCGQFGQVIRWMPPLIVTKAEVDRALRAFTNALDATAS